MAKRKRDKASWRHQRRQLLIVPLRHAISGMAGGEQQHRERRRRHHQGGIEGKYGGIDIKDRNIKATINAQLGGIRNQMTGVGGGNDGVTQLATTS